GRGRVSSARPGRLLGGGEEELTAFPSPRLRGEGLGEGLFQQPVRVERPLTRRALRVDLSPQEGRGKKPAAVCVKRAACVSCLSIPTPALTSPGRARASPARSPRPR